MLTLVTRTALRTTDMTPSKAKPLKGCMNNSSLANTRNPRNEKQTLVYMSMKTKKKSLLKGKKKTM